MENTEIIYNEFELCWSLELQELVAQGRKMP